MPISGMPTRGRLAQIDSTTRPKEIEASNWQKRQTRRLRLNLKMPRKVREGAVEHVAGADGANDGMDKILQIA